MKIHMHFFLAALFLVGSALANNSAIASWTTCSGGSCGPTTSTSSPVDYQSTKSVSSGTCPAAATDTIFVTKYSTYTTTQSSAVTTTTTSLVYTTSVSTSISTRITTTTDYSTSVSTLTSVSTSVSTVTAPTISLTSTSVSTVLSTLIVPTFETATLTVGSTSTLTSTIISTVLVPTLSISDAFSVSTVTVSPSASCDFCKVDIYGTELVFPYQVVTSTVAGTTIVLLPTQYGNGSRVTRTSTSTAGPACPFPSTWIFSGVELTSGTSYIYYSSLSHESLFPSSGVAGGCGLTTEPLVLPTTDFAALIYPTSSVPTTPTVAPTVFVNYIDTFPTVIAQLGGTPASLCDAPSETIASAAPPTSILTSTTTNSASTTTATMPNDYEP